MLMEQYHESVEKFRDQVGFGKGLHFENFNVCTMYNIKTVFARMYKHLRF